MPHAHKSGPFSVSTRRELFGTAGLLVAAVLSPIETLASQENSDGISRSAESIHQEPLFKAGVKRVYELLTEAAQFDKVVRLSAAMQGGMQLPTTPTTISKEPGGAFSLFGGHIRGRHLELLSPDRVVQAWRAESWPAGVYSIVRFVLAEEDKNTRVVFDHTGFPVGQAVHLADGWRSNYGEPMAKVLAAA